MNGIGMELALVTMPHKTSTVFFHGWPIIVLEDFLSECSAIDVTAAFTRMGIFDNLVGFLFIETTEVDSTEGFSVQDAPHDFVPL